VSVSYYADEDRLEREYGQVHEAAVAAGAAVLLGGRALGAELRRRLPCTAFCETLKQAVALAQGLAPSVMPPPRRAAEGE
jgi:hypothetical protein